MNVPIKAIYLHKQFFFGPKCDGSKVKRCKRSHVHSYLPAHRPNIGLLSSVYCFITKDKKKNAWTWMSQKWHWFYSALNYLFHSHLLKVKNLQMTDPAACQQLHFEVVAHVFCTQHTVKLLSEHVSFACFSRKQGTWEVLFKHQQYLKIIWWLT